MSAGPAWRISGVTVVGVALAAYAAMRGEAMTSAEWTVLCAVVAATSWLAVNKGLGGAGRR